MADAVLPRLEVEGVSKIFGPATVLSGATFAVAPGEVHALIGQNGSGKSTLIKILTGYHQPDRGSRVSVDGVDLSLPLQWSAARAAGISVVHQDLGLLDEMSVAENMHAGDYVQSRFTRRVHVRRQEHAAAVTLARLSADIEPTAPVSTLGAAQRATVGIARALLRQTPGTGLLILDEATRALGRSDRGRFHAMLRRLVQEGTSVLMVSHDLEEVMEYADTVTILRDGKVVGAGLPVSSLTKEEIARRMLGAAAVELAPAAPDPGLGVAPFEIHGLCGRAVQDLAFDLAPGSITGITGLPGSGFEEIPAILTGSRHGRGTLTGPRGVRLDLARSDVRRAMDAGVVLVPEGRMREGLAADITVSDNISSARRLSWRDRWLPSQATERELARRSIDELDIRPNSPTHLVSQLSGGNQQKVLMAKWLNAGPKVLVLHEPTQAVDVGARADILRLVQRVAASGVAVLLVSVEPADLTAICDRIYVFRAPSVLREATGADTDAVFNLIYNEPAAPAAS